MGTTTHTTVHLDSSSTTHAENYPGSDRAFSSIKIGGAVSIFAHNANEVDQLLLGVQQAREQLTDPSWAEAIAGLITSAIITSKDVDTISATLAESGPSVLVDHVSGRSFVVYVREVL